MKPREPPDSGARGLASLEKSIGLLDQRVQQATQADAARLRALLDESRRLLEGLEAMRAAREIHQERREKEMRLLETNAMLDLSRASQARGEMQASVARRAETFARESLIGVREEQASLAREREACALEAGEELGRLALALEEHRHAREECGERAQGDLQAELRKAAEAVSAEHLLRREAEGAAGRRLEEVFSSVSAAIQQERAEREAGQARMLSLLEETCGRIEGAMPQVLSPRRATQEKRGPPGDARGLAAMGGEPRASPRASSEAASFGRKFGGG